MTETMTLEDWIRRAPEMAKLMNRAEGVRWDRFTAWGNMIRVYGWLDRDDGRADFVLVDFYAPEEEGGDLDHSWVSSSPAFLLKAAGEEYGDHVPCRRVETSFGALIDEKVEIECKQLSPDAKGTWPRCTRPLGHSGEYIADMGSRVTRWPAEVTP